MQLLSSWFRSARDLVVVVVGDFLRYFSLVSSAWVLLGVVFCVGFWVVRSCCIGVFDVAVCFFGVAVGVEVLHHRKFRPISHFFFIVPTPTREVLDLSLTFTGFLFFSALAFALAFA